MTAKPGAATPITDQKLDAWSKKLPFQSPESLLEFYSIAFREMVALARQLERELATERAARAAAEGALKHILWIKDCGVDATDEHGVFRNHPDVERDAMYDIAKKALTTPGSHNGDI